MNFYDSAENVILRTKHMIDVLVTQHAKWIAGGIRMALLGQATASEVASTDHGRRSWLETRRLEKEKYEARLNHLKKTEKREGC